MKIQIMSDLHINQDKSYNIKKINSDLILVAGDTSYNIYNTIEFLQKQSTMLDDKPIVFIAGNHEYEDYGVLNSINIAKEMCDKSKKIIFLENDRISFEDFTIIGATLWTDFKLFGEVESYFCEQSVKNFSDFERIFYNDTHRISPHIVKNLFNKSYQYLDFALNNKTTDKNIIVTHFAPHFNSIHERYKNIYSSSYFASNCEALLGRNELWIHGHTHTNFNYNIEDTKIICNPKGYGVENTYFDENLIFDTNSLEIISEPSYLNKLKF